MYYFVANLDIKERIEDYEDSQEVNIPIKKLFVLVPESMYTPGKLNCENLAVSRNLETVVMNRAGISNRTYHNTVYKIKDTTWYVVMEGASPLQTFYEAMDRDARLKALRHEIVVSFVKKLRELLNNDQECRHLCEVVHFNGNLPAHTHLF